MMPLMNDAGKQGANPRQSKMLAALASLGVGGGALTALLDIAGHKLTLDESRFVSGPLIVQESAWNDTLPEWMPAQARAERVEIVTNNLDLPVGPTEMAAVMYGPMLEAPRPLDVSEIYLWASANAAARHMRVPIDEFWATRFADNRPVLDKDVCLPNGRHYHVWRPFALTIREKVIEAQRRRERLAKAPVRPTEAPPAVEFDQLALFG